jgi:RHS repeat-associated protein
VYRQDYLPFGQTILTSSGNPRMNATGGSKCSTNGYVASAAPTRLQFTGKERDAESGLDFFGARYASAAQGRFTSPDPSRLSAFFDNPQSWNMYSYAYNNPLQFVDKTGRWPTSIHNTIIEQAFQDTLAPDQIQILKGVSAQQDSILGGGQANALSFQHAMRAPGQSVAEAQQDFEDFVSMNEDAATKAQVSFWIAGNQGFSNVALKRFAAALHAILDSTSPAHAGFQIWDWRNPALVWRHHWTENTINQQQLNNAVAAAQNAFNSTFFPSFGDPFDRLQLQTQQQPPPQPTPMVTSKICYTLDDGTQVCQ